MSFSERTTVSDYPADQVISALQKEIRRGNLEEASFFALELLESGNDFVEKLWSRLLVISVEDVAEHQAVTQIRALRENFDEMEGEKPWDQHMQALKAVQILCEAEKDRIVSEIYDYLTRRRDNGYRIDIPDYAIDMHTKKGKEQGLGYHDFLTRAAHIENTTPGKNDTYLNWLLDYAKENE